MRPWINRCFVQIRFKDGYMEWCREVDEGEDIMPSDRNGNGYLMKSLEYSDPSYIRRCLSRHWRTIAEEEFEAWCTDEAMWPAMKTMKDFEKYFEWEVTEIVMDLEDGFVLSEEP